MADAPAGLGDLFAKRKKKVVKGSNLNNEAATKVEEKKTETKKKEEEGWEEEQIVAPTMKVEVAGKLMREDDKKEDESHATQAWKASKNSSKQSQDLNEKKYPTLNKSVGLSSNINIDDGSHATVNIRTTKNKFATLGDSDDDDDIKNRRPKEIKPAMVQKKKGEMETVAIKREVNKYSKADAKKKKKALKKKAEGLDSDDEVSTSESDAEEEANPAAKVYIKKKKREERVYEKEEEPVTHDVAEDVKIQPDIEASRMKYKGRDKLPYKDIPRSELKEEKENKQPVQTKKKMMRNFDEDEKPKVLQEVPW